MNKIAIVSDIHGNILALQEVIKDIESRNVDQVVNLGDHISGPLWPKETLELLKSLDWIHILGNHDRQLFEQKPGTHNPSDSYAYQFLDKNDLEWLSSLPDVHHVGNDFTFFHGTPLNDSVYLLETVENGMTRLANMNEIKERLGKTNCAIISCGHSHIPRVVRIQDMLIINPGSVGLQAYDDVSPEYHKIEVGSPHARYAILERQNDNWFTEIIAVPHDNNKAADQALKNDRKDWEKGLRTGFM
ncbi:MAG: metallophosphoesterase family protein [Ignavibacteria bacterium]|jgi:predicted phosphodiesterase